MSPATSSYAQIYLTELPNMKRRATSTSSNKEEAESPAQTPAAYLRK